MTNTSTTQQKLQKMVILSLFSALAFICTLIFRIQVAGFLTFDIKDALICVCAMSMGPLSGVLVSLIVAFVEMITISSTAYYGFFMNFLSSATFAFVASALYRRFNRLYGAVLALLSAATATVAVMLSFNLLITPLYFDMPRAAVVGMLLPTLLPFNAIKTVVNAAFTMLLYKPLTGAMVKAKILKKPEKARPATKTTLFVTLFSVIIIAVALVICFAVMDGKVQLWNV